MRHDVFVADTHWEVPGKTGRPNPSDLHLGWWRISLRTKSHFWLFLLRAHPCLRWGRWRCPSGASHRSQEHIYTGRETSESTGCSYTSASVVSRTLTAVWSRTLHRFHPLLTCWRAQLTLSTGMDDRRSMDAPNSNNYSRLTNSLTSH